MRFLALLRRFLVEQARDPASLLLSLLTAPAFVLVYGLVTGGGSTTYRVLVVNEDRPATVDGRRLAAGEDIVAALREAAYPTGQAILEVVEAANSDAARRRLADRDAIAAVVLPADFSRRLAAGSGASAILVGDLSHPLYGVAAVLAASAVERRAQALSGREPPVRIEEQALGASGTRTEFEGYVPGLLVIAIVMLVFTAPLVVARDAESGTLGRLRLTRMTALDYLGAVTVSQVALGVVGLLAAFATARAFGFRSEGPLGAAVLVGAALSLSVVGLGLVLACFARTALRAFLVANAGFVPLAFFTGAAFPVPEVPLLRVGGHVVGLWDALPPTHAVVALNKILSLGAGLGDVAPELGVLVGLSVVWFVLGAWLFRRRHLAAG